LHWNLDNSITQDNRQERSRRCYIPT